MAGEADGGVAALKLIDERKPDILLTDVEMAFMDGLVLARKAAEINPGMKTVFISGHDDVEFIRSALRLRARDCIQGGARCRASQDLNGSNRVPSLDRIESKSSAPGKGENVPKMMDLLTAKDDEALSAWLCAFFKTFADSRSTDASLYRGKCDMLIFEAFLCLKEQVTGDETVELSQHRVLDRLYHSHNLGQIKEIVVGYCQEIRSIIRLKTAPRPSGR
jgi:CheY-like chemotaxis protein